MQELARSRVNGLIGSGPDWSAGWLALPDQLNPASARMPDGHHDAYPARAARAPAQHIADRGTGRGGGSPPRGRGGHLRL